MKENLCMYDSVIPKLQSGRWTITTSQTLTKDGVRQNPETISASRQFQVGTNLFALETDAVINRCPLPGSGGSHTNTIAHMVLKEPELPWRAMEGKEPQMPGVALLMVSQRELEAGGYAQAQETTVAEFLKPKEDTIVPKISLILEETGKERCRFIRLKTETFDRIAPRMPELPLLAHCRQVYIGNKAEMELNKKGLFSVVMCSRLADYVPGENNCYQVHLVSLEGLWTVLQGNARETGKYYIDLVSLDTYSFTVTGKEPPSFRMFCESLSGEEREDMLLRIPWPDRDTEAGKRLGQGYVPMLYHTRTGEEGMAWYRSPLTPAEAGENLRPTPFYTADSAIIYDKGAGVFDLSLGAAWEAGRMAALQNKVFCRKMMELRQKGKAMIDLLLHQLLLQAEKEGGQDALKDPKRLEELCRNKILQLNKAEIEELLKMERKEALLVQALKDGVLEKVGDACRYTELEAEQGGNIPAGLTENMAELLEYFMEAQPKLLSSYLQEALQPAAAWLAKLWLLYPIPYDTLVPHKKLLPRESIRFFYIDENWLKAGYDGAVSLGMDCSRQAHFNRMMEELMRVSVEEEMLQYRASLYGEEHVGKRTESMSGFLIHSSLVDGWPTLEITARDKEGQALALLRMERLSPFVMLGIFDGIAVEIACMEPKETLQMKVAPGFSGFRKETRVMDLEGKTGAGSAAFVRPFLTMGDCVVFQKGGE